MSIELVTWRDAHFDYEDGDDADADFLNRTVGWVTEEGLWLRILHEIQGNGDEKAITRVPHGMVIERRVLAV